jgi:hypothetical protein
MMARERALLAFFLVPPFAGVAYYFMYSLTRWSVFSGAFWSDFIYGAAFAAIGVYFQMILFGVPIYLLFRYFNTISLISAVTAGIIVPIALIFLPTLWRATPDTDNVTISFFRENCHEIVDNVRTECGKWLLLRDRSLAIATGGLCGLLFWLIYASSRFKRQQT